MRPLLALLALPLALALWGGSLWWGLPWAVSLRLEPRAAGVAPPAAASPWRVVQVEMRHSVATIDGVAVGDAGQFDRYGVLAPVAGRVLCVWWPPGSRPVTLTPIGGALRDPAAVHLTESTPAACPVPER